MKYIGIKLLVGLSSVLIFVGCIAPSVQPRDANVIAGVDDKDYVPAIKKYSHYDRHYDGFFELYEVSALVINSDIENLLLQRKGHYLQWDQEHLRAEKEKSQQRLSTETLVVLSLFTPDFQYDDLAKKNSIWRVYLSYEGKQYDGKVKKITSKLAELRDLYPFHNRYSTPYEISFPISSLNVEQGAASLTLSSSLGTTTFKIDSVK